MEKEIKCWICGETMNFVKTTKNKILGGKVNEYKCSNENCGEIIYSPLDKHYECKQK